MEIELKVLEINPQDIRQKLEAIGARFQGREFQRNYMYDYPDQRLYREQDGSYIRLRLRYWPDTQQREVLLTYKQTISRTAYKIAEETETSVGDFEAMDTFLSKMGLIQVRLDEKLRETWLFEDLHFEIDEWAGLPPYLEVEADSEASVHRGLQLLGLGPQDATAENLQEVLAKYKIKATSLRFADFGRSFDFTL